MSFATPQEKIDAGCSIPLSNYWTLYFRHGMNANLSKNFYFEGTLVGAVERAKEHCKVMGYRYIWVRPLICNIGEEEEYRLHGGAPTEPGL
jgi:hypothetical protein